MKCIENADQFYCGHLQFTYITLHYIYYFTYPGIY